MHRRYDYFNEPGCAFRGLGNPPSPSEMETLERNLDAGNYSANDLLILRAEVWRLERMCYRLAMVSAGLAFLLLSAAMIWGSTWRVA